LSDCHVVWIITQADIPAQRFEDTAAYAVPNGQGFRFLDRWSFNLVQVIKAAK
jgi:hypothetical protein